MFTVQTREWYQSSHLPLDKEEKKHISHNVELLLQACWCFIFLKMFSIHSNKSKVKHLNPWQRNLKNEMAGLWLFNDKHQQNVPRRENAAHSSSCNFFWIIFLLFLLAFLGRALSQIFLFYSFYNSDLINLSRGNLRNHSVFYLTFGQVCNRCSQYL